MTIEIRLTGAEREFAVPDAVLLLRDFTGQKPEQKTVVADDNVRRDTMTIIAVATLVLSVPGAILASLQAIDIAKRNRLRTQINLLKATLASTGCEGKLTKDGCGTIDLARDSTDAVMDLLTSEDSK